MRVCQFHHEGKALKSALVTTYILERSKRGSVLH
jgi:hypothetical protein